MMTRMMSFVSPSSLLSVLAFLLLILTTHRHVIANTVANLCYNCLVKYSACKIDCNVISCVYGWAVDCSAKFNCWADCEMDLYLCCPGCGCDYSGGSSGGGTAADEQLQQDLAVILQTCRDAVDIANANADSLLNRNEFEQHIEEFTNWVCPGVDMQETYYNDEFMAQVYLDYSCILCMGLYDPYNPDAIDGDYDTCCQGSSLLPINLQDMTALESDMYCAAVFEYVFVQCHQPERDCLDSCGMKRSACYETNEACIINVFSSRDILLSCLAACGQTYLPCVESC